MRSLKVLVDLRRQRMLLPVYRKPFIVIDGQQHQHPRPHSIYTHRPPNCGPHQQQHRRPESPSYPQQQQQRWMVTTSQAKSILGFPPASTPTVTELREAYYKAAMECHPDVAAQPPPTHNAASAAADEDSNKKNKKKTAVKLDFRDLTEAYDYLLQHGHVNTDAPELYETMSQDDEQDYRAACVHVLGLRAELVEESKQNPMFLRWLSGNTGRFYLFGFFCVGSVLWFPAYYLYLFIFYFVVVTVVNESIYIYIYIYIYVHYCIYVCRYKSDGAQIWRNFLETQGGLAQRIKPPAAFLTATPEDTTTPKNPSESMKSRRKRVRR